MADAQSAQWLKWKNYKHPMRKYIHISKELIPIPDPNTGVIQFHLAKAGHTVKFKPTMKQQKKERYAAKLKRRDFEEKFNDWLNNQSKDIDSIT